MAILFRQDSGGSHWYTTDGNPRHEVPTKTGQTRPVWISDARRLGLLPSVTNILGIISKPQLDSWKLNQCALAALRNPRGQDEPEDYYCRRIVEMSKMGVQEAAELGSRIHGALDRAFAGEPFDETLNPHILPVVEWRNKTQITIVDRETLLVNAPEGYAGRADVLFRYGKNGIGILDYKSRKTTPGRPVEAYDGQAAQLAAYAAAYCGLDALPRVLMANVFISTTEPGRMEIIKHDNPARDFQFFRDAAACWRYVKGYDPRQAGAAGPVREQSQAEGAANA